MRGRSDCSGLRLALVWDGEVLSGRVCMRDLILPRRNFAVAVAFSSVYQRVTNVTECSAVW